MSQENLNRYLKTVALLSLIIFICYTILQIGSYFMNLVTIFGIAIVLTYVMFEPVNLLEAALKKIPDIKFSSKTINLGNKPFTIPEFIIALPQRVISIFIVYITFIVLVIIMVTQLVPPAISQVSDFASSIPRYVTIAEDKFEECVNYINTKFPEIKIPGLSKSNTSTSNIEAVANKNIPIIIHEQPHDVGIINSIQDDLQSDLKTTTPVKTISKEQIKAIENTIAEKVANELIALAQVNAKGALDNILTFATGAITALGYAITIFVLSFYFLLDGKHLMNGINILIPSKHLARAQELEMSIHNSLLGFLKGQVYLGIFTGLFMFPVYIAFGIPYSIFLSFFLAIAEILPVIGSTLGFIPAAIVILFTAPMKIIPIWIIFFIFQTIKDNIIAPKIVGNIIGLHPVTVMFALWIGYQVAGFFGILFAIPIASVINVTITFIIHPQGTPKESAANS